MTQKEKQLLLRDLCARLPYHPKGVKLNTPFDPKDITIVGSTGRFVETIDDEIEVERVRLYLRPMSNMTEEEKIEYGNIIVKEAVQAVESFTFGIDGIDWLNEHHFDYRGLIPMGLALEAPEGMYKIE